MELQSPLLILIILCVLSIASAGDPLDRSSFPAGFIFGTSSSAYQYEGSADGGGRGPSIWDTFTHSHPEKIADRSNGDIAIDFYHRYKEDVPMMKELGFDAYRFSISWTRILPNGSLSGGINRQGVEFYNKLIDEILSNGLQPFVTLFHWDSPQSLEDQYGGFLSPHIIEDFRDYAEVCFREFGDRVKHWITFNEPQTFTAQGYSAGVFAPGRCSAWEYGKCRTGDSGREPYLVAHHLLLSHAAAVKLYRDQYQQSQEGKIGIVLNSYWVVPYSDSQSNVDAAKRVLDFVFGWFMDPVTRGQYPLNMRLFVGSRLPKFTKEQSEMLKGSIDFLGLNYYTSFYALSLPLTKLVNVSYNTDYYANPTAIREGIPIGPTAGAGWLRIYPRGIRELLLYIKNNYNNPIIYITENGFDEITSESTPPEQILKDDVRTEYFQQHLSYVHEAISEGVDVRGFFAWSLFDNFEWSSGYTDRFGLVYVDYKDGLKRHPKNSALWFQKFLTSYEAKDTM